MFGQVKCVMDFRSLVEVNKFLACPASFTRMLMGKIREPNMLVNLNSVPTMKSRSAKVSGQNFANADSSASDTFEKNSTSSSSPENQLRQLGKNFRPSALKQSHHAHQSEILISDFPGREGYDSSFLGKELPLPKMGPRAAAAAAPLLSDPSKHELEYTNFSIVMNKERRQPMFTAVNINGPEVVDVPRKGKWTLDSRISQDHQLGNEAYKSNAIDRGHMVRRRDPVWGPDPNRASNDTFAYTNAGLQHGSLNQKEWLQLENHVLDTSKQTGQKFTVMTGPIFRDSDPKFDNRGKMKPTQIPQEFWKVVVWNDPKEGLQGKAFVLSQAEFVGGNDSIFKSQGLPSDRFEVYQVPISKLEQATDLSFGDIANQGGHERVTEDRMPTFG